MKKAVFVGVIIALLILMNPVSGESYAGSPGSGGWGHGYGGGHGFGGGGHGYGRGPAYGGGGGGSGYRSPGHRGGGYGYRGPGYGGWYWHRGWYGRGGWPGYRGWYGRGWRPYYGGGFWVGPGWWSPWWWGLPAYWGVTLPYYAAPAVEEPSPSVYVDPAPQPEGQYYWYYCENSSAYYPYVRECPGGWTRVTPTPTAPNR